MLPLAGGSSALRLRWGVAVPSKGSAGLASEKTLPRVGTAAISPNAADLLNSSLLCIPIVLFLLILPTDEKRIRNDCSGSPFTVAETAFRKTQERPPLNYCPGKASTGSLKAVPRHAQSMRSTRAIGHTAYCIRPTIHGFFHLAATR